MDKTQVDKQVGAPVFAVNLIGRPPKRVREHMSILQDSLATAVSPEAVHRTPAESLHLSVFQFAWARQKEDQQSAWAMCRNNVQRQLESAVSLIAPVFLNAARLEVRPAAIIVVFSPSPELEALRNRISAMPSIAGLASRRPHLQHVSLFRYSKEVPLEEFRAACNDIEVDLPPWRLSRLDLVRETVYPSLAFDSLQSFELTGEDSDPSGNESAA
jgi:hypothetical protein